MATTREFFNYSTEGLANLEPAPVLMDDTLRFVQEMRYSPAERRSELLQEYAGNIITDPGLIRPLLHNLSMVMIAEPELDSIDAQTLLIEHTERVIASQFKPENWPPDKIARLINARINGSDIHGPDIEKVEAALFNSPISVNEAIDLFYSTAWAMIATPRHDIRRELYSILTMQKDWLLPSSQSALFFMAGLFASDDIHLVRYHAITNALDYVSVFTNQLNNLSLRFFNLATNQPPEIKRQWVGIVEEQKQALLNKFDPLSRMYDEMGYFDQDSDKRSEYEMSHPADAWPSFVVRNPNEPLRRLVLERFGDHVFRAKWENKQIGLQAQGFEPLSTHPVQLDRDLSLVVLAKGLQSQEQRDWLINEVTQTLLLGQSPNPNRHLLVPLQRAIAEARLSAGLSEYFDQERTVAFAIYRTQPEESMGRLASILEYHRLPISTELFEDISKKITEIRKALHILYTRRVGQRGYKAIISDPYLRNTKGYRSITFKQNPDSNTLSVNLDLAGQTYELSLDSDYRIQPSADVKRFASLQDQVWLELLLLSHLRKIMCTEEDRIEEDLFKKEKQALILKKQRIYRGEHLMWMRTPLHNPDGTSKVDGQGRLRFKHYSAEADKLFKASNLPDNELERHYGLSMVNQARAVEGRGGTQETGWWTYVKPSETTEDSFLEPVKIAFDKVEDIYQVIPQDRISDAELKRLEDEVLAEISR